MQTKSIIRYFLGGIVLLILLPLLTFAKDATQDLYGKEEYAKALQKYNAVLQEHPEWEEAHFGKGASLYKTGQYEQALQEFEQAIPMKDPRQKSAVFYNMGNTLFQAQRLRESLAFYKRALELNPRDYDAKHNYELARVMLQQQQQQQDPQQNQEQNQKEQPQQSDQEQQEEQDQQQNQDSSGEQEDSQEQSQKPRPEHRKDEEKEQQQENAAQVLDALKDKEKELMQERLKAKYSGIKKEKDW